jgi:Fur family peroxide stress response transcriptional regulator
MVEKKEIQEKLTSKGLRLTPQRMVILEAIYNIENHPTAEKIIEYVRSQHPGIASGTVYKVLDTLVENKLVKRVTSDKDIMRYDGILENHHHLYCNKCDRIHYYVD